MQVPPFPTAKHAAALGQLTLERKLSVPELCCGQVAPPSLVALTVATFISRPTKYSPLTVTQVETVGQLTPLNCPSPEYCRDHVVPPSVVAVIWPMPPDALSTPTAKHTEVLGQLTPRNVVLEEVVSSWDHVAPPKGDRWGPGSRIPCQHCQR